MTRLPAAAAVLLRVKGFQISVTIRLIQHHMANLLWRCRIFVGDLLTRIAASTNKPIVLDTQQAWAT